MAATPGVPALAVAVQVAGDLLNPRMPAIGRLGPTPEDWIAVGDIHPVGTFHHDLHIREQWVSERNHVQPSQIDADCPAVWAWRCERGHVWVQTLSERLWTDTDTCPRCDLQAMPLAQRPGKEEDARRKLSLQEALRKVPVTPDFPTTQEIAAAVEAGDGKIHARLEWQCHARWRIKHEPYQRSLSEIVYSHHGCPMCWKREHFTPSADVSPGDAFYSFVEQGGSKAETRLRRALLPLLPIDGTVNAVRIKDDFFGKPMVHPDILCPALRVAIEFDGTAHDNHITKEGRARDCVKDELLAEVGWRVVRVCPPPVKPLHEHDIVIGKSEDPARVATRVAAAVRTVTPVVDRAR